MIEVRLTRDEMEFAAMVGARRQIASILAGRKDAYGYNGDPWQAHIEGAMGELVMAKARNRFWTGCGQSLRDDTDVGGVQIRTRRNHDYELYLWPNDPEDAYWVLVTGQPPVFRVRGYILGSEAKRPEWFKSLGREPAYFVPTSELKPL